MASRVSPTAGKQTWSERGSAAVDAGDLATAEECFREAVKADRRNARNHFNLAVVLEARGTFGAAAEHLTQALALDPKSGDAARRLTSLASRRTFPGDVVLDRAGLRAALHHESAASWVIAKLILQYLEAKGPLGAALEAGRREGWMQAARALCLVRTADALRDELFVEVLRSDILRHADVERLLTAVRAVLLLEAAPERFSDPDLLRLAIAMMQQVRANEYIWSVSEAEAARLAAAPFSLQGLLGGDMEEGRKALLALLYTSFGAAFGEDARPQTFAKVRPKALREAIQAAVAEDSDLRERAGRLPSLGDIGDAVSAKVAKQYERNPYPRWTRLRKPGPGEMRRRLGGFFPPERLAFLDKPYEILIAGCGTGHQAVRAALESTNARVTAVDLSRIALAYGARMAERQGAGGITFLQGDIQSLPADARFAGRFHIIECVGVLHHMADPFGAWRSLLGCLAPGGLMLVALYSATARRIVADLRGDPAHPGPDCDEESLRRFRHDLMERPAGELGSGLQDGPDFHTASEFRDLLCHVQEQCVTIPQIAAFLAENGLVFRGFWTDAQLIDQFHDAHPDETWPGRLEAWAEFEAANPHAFGAMYNFWCDRA